MSEFGGLFLKAWVPTQIVSLIALGVGSRLAGNRHLLRLGQLAHAQKLRALERMWPLTRIRPALERKDKSTCAVILSSLVVLKSVASLAFGVVMVFWLPLASLIVPSIVAVHDPTDPGLRRWVHRVAALQVTSHALAAALGFAVVAMGPWVGQPLATAIAPNIGLLAVVCALSLGFAIAAGSAEAGGLLRRGI